MSPHPRLPRAAGADPLYFSRRTGLRRRLGRQGTSSARVLRGFRGQHRPHGGHPSTRARGAVQEARLRVGVGGREGTCAGSARRPGPRAWGHVDPPPPARRHTAASSLRPRGPATCRGQPPGRSRSPRERDASQGAGLRPGAVTWTCDPFAHVTRLSPQDGNPLADTRPRGPRSRQHHVQQPRRGDDPESAGARGGGDAAVQGTEGGTARWETRGPGAGTATATPRLWGLGGRGQGHSGSRVR